MKPRRPIRVRTIGIGTRQRHGGAHDGMLNAWTTISIPGWSVTWGFTHRQSADWPVVDSLPTRCSSPIEQETLDIRVDARPAWRTILQPSTMNSIASNYVLIHISYVTMTDTYGVITTLRDWMGLRLEHGCRYAEYELKASVTTS